MKFKKTFFINHKFFVDVIIDKDQDINALLQDGKLFLIIYQFKNDDMINQNG
jgi:hypothetical protein